jgi:anti-sigma regulatory factor (Ser/Thr protein kinase)
VGEQRRRRFDPSPESVREARQFARDAIAAHADGEVGEDLLLALTEMTTNAVLHAATPFEVVIVTDGQVRLEVEDGSTDEPVMASPTATTVGGRGLRIIEDVCDRWGVHVVQDRKCVWCERDLT